MTREEAEVYAEGMSFADALNNLAQAKCIPYRKATFIKMHELINLLENDSALSKAILKMAYDKGYREGEYAVKTHLDLCIEEGEYISMSEINRDYIKFPKGSLKKRGKDYVVYNYAWLKDNWQTELKAIGIDWKEQQNE